MAIASLSYKAFCFEVKGNVIDNNNNPIDYAIIALQNIKDSTFVTSSQTNETGEFSLETNIYPVKIVASSIGYLTTEAIIDIPKDTIFTIVLNENAAILNEITILGRKPLSKMTNEGVITDIHNTALSNVGSAIDVLENIPLVQKESDGFTIFGKGTPVIYIDGHRIYNISELDGLKSSDIKEIEIITNPGVKYDASIPAIIKISKINKDDRAFAVDSRNTFIQSKYSSVIEQLSLNYRTKNIYIYESFKYDNKKTDNIKHAKQIIFADTIWNNSTSEYINRRSQLLENTFSIDFKINKDNIIGGRYILRYSPQNTKYLESYSTVIGNNTPFDNIYNAGDETYNDSPFHQLNIFYSGNVYSWKLELDFTYLNNGNKSESNYIEKSDITPSRYVSSLNHTWNSLYNIKFMGIHKLFNGNVSFGCDYNTTLRHDNYLNKNNIVPSSNLEINESNICPFMEYKRNLSLGIINLGLRYEHIRTTYVINNSVDQSKSHKYNQIFPSFTFSSRLENVQWQFNYNTRIQRPSYSQLSNNVVYINQFTLQRGNPFLKSEYIHDLTLQGMWRFLLFNVSFQNKNNAIIYWASQEPSNELISIVSFKNVNTIKKISGNLSCSYKFGLWNPKLTIGMAKQFFILETLNNQEKFNKPLFYGQLTNSFNFPHSFSLVINSTFQSKGNYQNILLNRNTFYFDFNLYKSFYNGNFTINVKASDLLKSKKDGNLLHMEKMVMDLVNSYDSRNLTITLQYLFNNIKNRDRKNALLEKELNRL